MIIGYDNEIMKLNDSVDDYKFKVICDSENLISITNFIEDSMKIFLKDWYEEFVNKKSIIVSVSKSDNFIAFLKISVSGYVSDLVGYKTKIPVNYDEFPVDYDEKIVIEEWGKKKNLTFSFITQEEIDELLRS